MATVTVTNTAPVYHLELSQDEAQSLINCLNHSGALRGRRTYDQADEDRTSGIFEKLLAAGLDTITRNPGQ